jgi:hydrogenase-4 component E
VNGSSYSSVLTLAAGAVLVCAVAILWLASIRSVIKTVAAQGIALGLVAVVLGVHLRDGGLLAAAAVVIAVKGIAIPLLLGRASGVSPGSRESRPLVNVPASLVASAALIVLAFVTGRSVARFVGTTAGALVPIGLATLLIGFFVLVARRRPTFQIVGLLMVDTGIALTAFLCTAGFPFLIELGVSFDVLLGVVVLMVLSQRLRLEFGDVDIDELQELHD